MAEITSVKSFRAQQAEKTEMDGAFKGYRG